MHDCFPGPGILAVDLYRPVVGIEPNRAVILLIHREPDCELPIERFIRSRSHGDIKVHHASLYSVERNLVGNRHIFIRNDIRKMLLNLTDRPLIEPAILK